MKSTERLPIVLTAILKSGMAYLPLDSEFPAARITHILQESEPKMVIIEEGGKLNFPFYEKFFRTNFLSKMPEIDQMYIRAYLKSYSLDMQIYGKFH